MTENGRPTALGVARARFVEGLPRKAQELRGSLALLAATPGDERVREELRRRLHALWASAQVFQIDPLCESLRDAIDRLDQGRDEKRPVALEDIDALAALAATLPLLGNQLPAGQRAVPSAPPPPMSSRTSPGIERSALRPPRASQRMTIPGAGPPTPHVELDAVYGIAVVGGGSISMQVEEAFASETRVEVHSVSTLDRVGALLASVGPDLVLVETRAEADALRSSLDRIGAMVRVMDGRGAGSVPPPEQSAAFLAAVKASLRLLPTLMPRQSEARLADLDAALVGDLPTARNRFDGVSIAALLDRIQRAHSDASIHLRDAHDAIDVEVRGGQVVDVIRTASDGWFARGPAALVPLLGLRRGLVAVERATNTVRATIKNPSEALATARERLSALELATRAMTLSGVDRVELDPDAAPSARKERSADGRVIDALLRTKSVRSLIEAGTSREGLASALVALARSGALVEVRGPGGEDRIAEAIAFLRERPPVSEPTIRTLTQVPPPPAPRLDVDDDEEADDVELSDALPTVRPPAADDDAPTVEQLLDEPESDASEPDTDASESESDASESESDASEPESDASESEPEAPKPEPEAPKPEPEAPKPEPEAPKPEPEAPKPEPEAPKSEPEAPKSEPEAPKSEPEAPKPEPEAPKSEPEAPKPAARPRPAAIESKPASSGTWKYLALIAVLFVAGFVAWRVTHSPTPPPTPDAVAEHPAETPPETPTEAPSEPPAVDVPTPAVEVEASVEAPSIEAPSIEASARSSLGRREANASAPPEGSGWVALDESAAAGITVGGVAIAPGAHASVPVGVQPVVLPDGRVRFVRVDAEQTRVIPAL